MLFYVSCILWRDSCRLSILRYNLLEAVSLVVRKDLPMAGAA